MEKLNFYNVQIGAATKRGNFLANHEFVCKIENANQTTVYNHFCKKYSGFNVRVEPIETIITEIVPTIEKINFFNETKLECELRKEIKKLKEGSRQTWFNREYNLSDISEDAVAILSEMKELEETVGKKELEIRKIVKKAILDKHDFFVKEIEFNDKINRGYESITVKIRLRNELNTDLTTNAK